MRLRPVYRVRAQCRSALTYWLRYALAEPRDFAYTLPRRLACRLLCRHNTTCRGRADHPKPGTPGDRPHRARDPPGPHGRRLPAPVRPDGPGGSVPNFLPVQLTQLAAAAELLSEIRAAAVEARTPRPPERIDLIPGVIALQLVGKERLNGAHYVLDVTDRGNT